jgi:hypothetical protein
MAMPVDIGQTLELHRRILSDLDLREDAATEKEAAARKALEEALQDIAADRQAIKQYRELLAQAEKLYQTFVGANRSGDSAALRQPAEAPEAATTAEQASVPAFATEDEEASRQPFKELVPDAPSLTNASVGPEVSPLVEELRSHISINLERDGRSGNWWAGIWKSGPRNSEQEISWSKALPPVEGAERAVWDLHNAKSVQD